MDTIKRVVASVRRRGKMAYEVKGWLKFADEDVYSKGCIPGGSAFSGMDRFESNTVEELLQELMDFCGQSNKENVLLNSCGEDGRIDIQGLEDGDGTIASAPEIVKWKRGKQRLWAVTYIFRVEYVTRETRRLQAEGYTNNEG